MDERTVSFARELERRDDELADAIDRVERLLADVERLGDRAADVSAELARAPERERAAAGAAARARDALGAARHDAERARSERLEAEASGAEACLGAARRGEEQALDAVRRAEERLARADADAEQAHRDGETARREAIELEARAQQLAGEVADLPRVSREGAARPLSGLAGLGRWSSHVRAALWVVRSGLQGERERVVREANELAASVFGGAHGATSVASVRERLERAG